MKRVLTAALLVPAATWIIFFAPWPVFLAVAGLLAALCYAEYGHLVAAHGAEPLLPVAIASGLAFLLAPSDAWLAAVLLALLGMAFALRATDLAHALPTAGAFALGVLYIFGAWKCGVELRTLSPHWLFFACALNWIGDTAAMYTGKTLGRRKLAPRVSPGKTVEGALGSCAASVLFGVLYVRWALPDFPLVWAAALALAGNAAGQLGDLAESAIKRGAHVKDSGNLLPGHGGVLDRLDSSLFSMPAVLGILRWIS